MFCKQCGKDLKNYTGAKCPTCNTTIGKGGRFCPDCGERVTGPGAVCRCKTAGAESAPVAEKPPVKTNTAANEGGGWLCVCGQSNQGKFCSNCGSPHKNGKGSQAKETDLAKKDASKPVAPAKKLSNPVFAKIVSNEDKFRQSRLLQEEAAQMAFGKSLEEVEQKIEEIENTPDSPEEMLEAMGTSNGRLDPRKDDAAQKKLEKEAERMQQKVASEGVKRENKKKMKSLVSAAQEASADKADEKRVETQPVEENRESSPAQALFPNSFSDPDTPQGETTQGQDDRTGNRTFVSQETLDVKVDPSDKKRQGPDKKKNDCFAVASNLFCSFYFFSLMYQAPLLTSIGFALFSVVTAFLDDRLNHRGWGYGILLAIALSGILLFVEVLKRGG